MSKIEKTLPTSEFLYEYYDLLTKDPKFHTGRMNEKLLAELVNNMIKSPTYDTIFHFVNCLDFFYSTGLKYSDKLFSTKKNIAELILQNWDTGIRLSEVAAKDVNCEKVDHFRTALKTCFPNEKKKDYYSFVTKVFHNLNCSYFIWDRNVYHFLIKHQLAKSNMKTQAYQKYYSTLIEVKNKITWPYDHDKLDLAIWSIVNKHSEEYGIKKSSKV